MVECPRCGAELSVRAKYCRFCGLELKKPSFSDKVSNFTSKFTDCIKEKTQPIIQDFRYYSTKTLDKWIKQLRNNSEQKIGFFQLSEKNRQNLANSLSRIRRSLAEVETSDKSVAREEMWENPQDLQEWQSNVERRLAGERCIVCFKQLSETDDIAICPKCGYGGCVSHIHEWFKMKDFCPLCREKVDEEDLIIKTAN